MIYVKYVFEELAVRGARESGAAGSDVHVWQLPELRASPPAGLPDGLDGMYAYVLAEVGRALKDYNGDLLDMLKSQVGRQAGVQDGVVHGLGAKRVQVLGFRVQGFRGVRF